MLLEDNKKYYEYDVITSCVLKRFVEKLNKSLKEGEWEICGNLIVSSVPASYSAGTKTRWSQQIKREVKE